MKCRRADADRRPHASTATGSASSDGDVRTVRGERAPPISTTVPTSTATSTNDHVNDVAPARPPIAPGAARPAPYAVGATPAIALPAPAWPPSVPIRPAAANTSGTTVAIPMPSNAKPTIVTGVASARITRTMPTVPTSADTRTVVAGP